MAAATLHTGRVEVADTARGVGGLAADDWAEAVAVTTGGSSLSPRSPEQWARSVFEDAPGPVRWFLVTGWRSVLRLRLGPRPAPTHVLGWRILTMATDVIVLELTSPLMTARLVLRAEAARVVMTTFVRYEHRAAPAIWSLAALIHRRAVPYLLKRAAAQPPKPR
ncbi:DUF2867 domain-containing protein [Streptomyces varsoviensis]|uniref:DUF2867 domain-containing protein n=1 Tax=Streptomyces varsoviensis TaxID=67373 RepID=UPI000A7F0E78|nr:DUF2867 domain-containing protein [Streptomyces varsoviensis]